jgi:predicted GNAT superfamily acetyltransferase
VLDVASTPVTGVSAAEGARQAAARAAAASGVEVSLLDGMDGLQSASDLLARIWATDEASRPVSAEFLRALTHAGGYVAGATSGGRLVAASVGFLGRDEAGLLLHSHISGVAPDSQCRRVGFALKQHQRAWALAEGLDRVVWTFDPLVRRNAYFNLAKLGAVVTGFHTDFYGSMADGINAGDDSDRAIVEWRLLSPVATAAAEGTGSIPADVDGAGMILREDGRGEPEQVAATGDHLTAWVPEDVVALRRDRPDQARRWRLALRATFGRAVEDGYRAEAITRSGWYVLRK